MSMPNPIEQRYAVSPDEARVLIDMIQLYQSASFHTKICNDLGEVAVMIVAQERVPSDPTTFHWRVLRIAMYHTMAANDLVFKRFAGQVRMADLLDGATLARLTQRFFKS